MIFIDPGETRYTAICEDCLREKQGPYAAPHRFPEGESLDDARIEGELPLDCDAGSGECRNGHGYRVAREGSEGARH